MNKKVILVHPPMYLKALYGDLAEAGSELPPQGLCLVAAVLREKGYEPVIIDATAEKLSLEETLSKIKAELPVLFVGFSLYYVCEEAVSKIAKKLKKSDPDLPIVVGGGHVSILQEKILEDHPEFDIAVIGEGEKTVLELIKALKRNQNLKEIKGIIYREGKKIVKNPPRLFIKNLDTLPFPAWDLLPTLTKFYTPAGDSLKRWPSTGLVTSRGCPGTCFFCNKNSFGVHVRQNSPEYVIAELKDLISKFGIKDVYFQDDTFTANRNWVLKFCKLLQREKLDLTWACHGRTDYVDLPLLKAMKKTGCWQISFGLESGSQKVLDAINKQTTVEQNKKALKLCQEAGISVKGLLMIGTFGETHQTIEETRKFLLENPLNDYHMTFFTIIPGTVASRIWPKYGKNKVGKAPAVTLTPSFIPLGLTKEELIKKQKEIYRQFYFRPKIIWYFLKKLRYPHQRKKVLGSTAAFLRYTVFKAD